MTKDDYLKNKTFCMLPWTHMHMWPNGDTYPCCLGDSRMPVGSAHKNSMQEIWNDEPMRKLRRNMLAGEKSPECRRCYEQEEHGVQTLRMSSNKEFAHHWDKVEETEEDGSAGQVNMAYLDIRFSNFCNLRCRSCGPNFSTSWYQDHVKLYGDPGIPQLLKVNDDEDKFFKDLEPMLLEVEKVYFAGGEAIITEEHYRVLDFWIKHNMKDIKLEYTTNFTKMRFKQKSIFEYWNSFDKVNVAASLDASWERGEYLRKNLVWSDIVQNRRDMIRESPHVEFWITPTVSVYTAYNLPDFHKEWIEEGLLKPENFRINPLLDPEFMRIQVLARKHKREVEQKYRDHIEYLKQFDCPQVIKDFEGLISYMWESKRTQEVNQLIKQTEAVDRIRNEDWRKVFPEIADLAEESMNIDFWRHRQ